FPFAFKQENCIYETTILPLDEKSFEKSVTPIVQEYFEHGDTNEVAEMLRDLNLEGMKCGLPMLAVSLALEGKASHREMTSKLLHDLCGTLLSTEDVEVSFDKLLQDLSELVLDTPRAPQAILMVLESSGDSTFKMMLKLLESLWKSAVITLDQMERGYDRIYREIPDINLDVPHAYSVLERFVEDCFKAGIISKQIRDLCPSRGRKRFVSEGDGGRLKSESY
ncbi:programmed cell death protein 4, partial [Bombina bombina]|uniref:programmed cell death protein 4 n=1 Tax=Bombina bombina TaxID=8345 RepID=UPI00235B1DEA